MRLVDADALKKEFPKDTDWEYPVNTNCYVCEIIDSQPTIEPEIIACGDCKHWICHERLCGYWNHGVKPLMWCSQAERREE